MLSGARGAPPRARCRQSSRKSGEDETLVQQAKSNSESQFEESPDLQAGTDEAVLGAGDVLSRVSEIIFAGDANAERARQLIGRAFYHLQRVDLHPAEVKLTTIARSAITRRLKTRRAKFEVTANRCLLLPLKPEHACSSSERQTRTRPLDDLNLYICHVSLRTFCPPPEIRYLRCSVACAMGRRDSAIAPSSGR